MQINEYELGSKVQEDGLGVLYNADNVTTAERVYLRVLNECHVDDAELVECFHRCADFCCSVENKGQLQTLGQGRKDDWHYIILEYANFRPLEIVLGEHRFISVMDHLSFIERLAVNLRAYHLEGLVHGHLNPKNIFVNRDLTQIRISDFGFEPLVRLLLRKKESFLSDCLPFYAPEMRVVSGPIDRQTDIFSIGAIFYKLLLNDVPGRCITFWDEDLEAQDIIIPPSLQRLEIPECLDHLILSTLEPEIEKRCRNLSFFINKLYEAKSEINAAAGTLTAGYSDYIEADYAVAENSAHAETASEAAIEDSSVAQDDPEIEANDETAEATEAPTSDQDRAQATGVSEDSQADDEQNTDGHHADAAPINDGPTGETDEGETDTDSSPMDPAMPAALENGPVGSENESSDEPAEQAESDQNGRHSETLSPEYSDCGQNGQSDLSEAESSGAADGKNASADSSDFYDEISKSFPSMLELQPGSPLNDNGNHSSEDQKKLLDDLISLNGADDRESPPDSSKLNAESTDFALDKAQTQLMEIFGEDGVNGSDSPVVCSTPPMLEDITSEIEADDTKSPLHSQTEEFATTDTISVLRPKFARRSTLARKKMLLLALVPLACLGVLAGFAFDWFSSGSEPEMVSRIRDTASIPMEKTAAAAAEPVVKIAQKDRIDKSVVDAGEASVSNNKIPVGAKSVAASVGLPIRRLDRSDGLVRSQQPPAAKKQSPPKLKADLTPKPVLQTNAIVPQTAVFLRLHIKHVNSPKRADVYLDGKFVGRSDVNGLLTIPELEVKYPYLIRIESTGFQMWAKEVSLGKPGTNNRDVALQPTEAAETPKPVQRTNVSKKATITVILANPQQARYAFIYVNGKLWKENIAPAELELTEGKYVLEVKKEGYVSDPPAYTIDLVGGERKSYRFYLSRK